MQVPRVFVSSTFYDLKQIRADLRAFIEDLGYEPLLSEYSSFPLEPDTDTVTNCLRRVEQADLFVLIIGSRYGDDSHSSKSVTNLEYLAARANGTYVYAFVERSIIAQLPIWEKNSDADFGGIVDNPKLFEFVKQVRTIHRTWTFEFSTADDIKNTLVRQFAYLFGETLRWRHRVEKGAGDSELTGLSGPALRLALERPPCWEYLLFAAAVTSEIDRHRDVRQLHKFRLTFGTGEHLSLSNVGPWMQARLVDLRRMVGGIHPLFGDALKDALGPPGQPGSVSKIAFVARTLGEFYKEFIQWSQILRKATVPDLFVEALDEMSKLTDDMIENIEAFGPYVTRTVMEALAAPKGDEPMVVAIELKIAVPTATQLNSVIDRIQEQLDERAIDLGLPIT